MNKQKAEGPWKNRPALKLVKGFLLILFLLWTLFPLYWMFITSFKTRQEIYGSVTLWPHTFVLSNYTDAFKTSHFGRYIGNSLYVTLLSSSIILLVSLLGGYGLARYNFKGKNLIMMIFLVSQMIPLVVAIIPMYVIYGKLGLIDNLNSLVISYTVANVPFCLITMSSFYKGISPALEEAAMIDGCSRFQAVVRVIIPLLAPGLVAVFVFAFTGCWNELYYAIMMINSEEHRTIPVGLMSFVQKFDVNWGSITASATVTLIPVVVMFLMVQKHIVAGMTAGAVKE